MGRLILTGFPGKTIPSGLAAELAQGALAGVVLFQRNFDDVEGCRELCLELVSLDPAVWIAIDQEGGRVARLKARFRSCPCARLGSSGRPSS
ncbi:MAG: beta-N-acetylhexosaminidase, partial [Myxococcales bacterium]|nr:beta-N-acetylhexosaminidase [Myxococcales bacterium]